MDNPETWKALARANPLPNSKIIPQGISLATSQSNTRNPLAKPFLLLMLVLFGLVFVLFPAGIANRNRDSKMDTVPIVLRDKKRRKKSDWIDR